MREAILLLALMLFSGCVEPSAPATPDPPDTSFTRSPTVVVLQPQETDDPQESEEIWGRVLGHDDAPLRGAKVTLDGEWTAYTTDQGAFRFENVPVGRHNLRISANGYYITEETVTTRSEGPVMHEFSLKPIPYHTTLPYHGYSTVTSDPITGWNIAACDDCIFQYPLEVQGLDTLLIETVAESGQVIDLGDPHDFYVVVENATGKRIHASYTDNPGRMELPVSQLGYQDTTLTVKVYPQSLPAPELNKKFDVFVTAFYHGPPTTGWSVAPPAPE